MQSCGQNIKWVCTLQTVLNDTVSFFQFLCNMWHRCLKQGSCEEAWSCNYPHRSSKCKGHSPRDVCIWHGKRCANFNLWLLLIWCALVLFRLGWAIHAFASVHPLYAVFLWLDQMKVRIFCICVHTQTPACLSMLGYMQKYLSVNRKGGRSVSANTWSVFPQGPGIKREWWEEQKLYFPLHTLCLNSI